MVCRTLFTFFCTFTSDRPLPLLAEVFVADVCCVCVLCVLCMCVCVFVYYVTVAGIIRTALKQLCSVRMFLIRILSCILGLSSLQRRFIKFDVNEIAAISAI